MAFGKPTIAADYFGSFNRAMGLKPFTAVVILAVGCSRAPTTVQTPGEATPTQAIGTSSDATVTGAVDNPSDASAILDAAEAQPGTVVPLTKKQQDTLLSKRVDGGMTDFSGRELSFGQFASWFLGESRLYLNYGVALFPLSQEIGEAPLQSPFPRFYKPTLREFLDSIALQTFSAWKYDPTSRHFKTYIKNEPPVRTLAIFEFTPKQRTKPFQVTLTEGWKAIDKGSWLMLVPPSFPVGMDIYEMGTYSSDEKANENKLLEKVPTEVLLAVARRFREDVAEKDLKTAKVGPHDAVFYESMVPSQLEREVRLRLWVFMVKNRCYLVISTILPELETEIYPDVEKMLASFQVKR